MNMAETRGEAIFSHNLTREKGKVEWLLFDLDGTLTDPKEGITKCVQYALSRFGIERSCEELVCFIGPPLIEQFMAYAGFTREQAMQAVEVYRERFAPIGIFENRAYEGAVELVRDLKAAGKTLALATSKPQVFAEQIVKKYGFEPYLDIIVGSELNGHLTNKAQVIAKVMDTLGADPNETIMIGDREHDVIGAKANGIKTVGVGFGYAAEGELEAAGAEYYAETMEELRTLLFSL